MKVRRRRYRSGNVVWQLDLGLVAGKRQQISFATKGEAESEMARRRGELRRVGEVGAMLTDGERLRFARARDELAAMGGTIEEAVARGGSE